MITSGQFFHLFTAAELTTTSTFKRLPRDNPHILEKAWTNRRERYDYPRENYNSLMFTQSRPVSLCIENHLFAPCMKVSGDVFAGAGLVEKHRLPASVAAAGKRLQCLTAPAAAPVAAAVMDESGAVR